MMSLINQFKAVFGASGGLGYHAQALLYSRMWRSYRSQLQSWLDALPWNFKQPLLLVGPSAGYSLSADWLEQFETITAIDPDPLARMLFEARFPGIQINWLKPPPLLPINHPRGLLQTLASFNEHSILFCNLLGQIPLLIRGRNSPAQAEGIWRDWAAELEGILSERPWASFHDAASLLAPEIWNQLKTQAYSGPKFNHAQELAQYFLKSQLLRHHIELTDHLMLNHFRNIKKATYITWLIRPGSAHIVECLDALT